MKKLIIIFSSVIVFLLLILLFCTERTDAGHEGIRVKAYGSEKGVQDISLVTGRVFYNPFTEWIYEFPTYVQTVNYEAFTVNAKDGSVFTVDPTLSIRVIAGIVLTFFQSTERTSKRF